MITLTLIYLFMVMLSAILGLTFGIVALALKIVLALSIIYFIYELIFDREHFLKR